MPLQDAVAGERAHRVVGAVKQQRCGPGPTEVPNDWPPGLRRRPTGRPGPRGAGSRWRQGGPLDGATCDGGSPYGASPVAGSESGERRAQDHDRRPSLSAHVRRRKQLSHAASRRSRCGRGASARSSSSWLGSYVGSAWARSPGRCRVPSHGVRFRNRLTGAIARASRRYRIARNARAGALK